MERRSFLLAALAAGSAAAAPRVVLAGPTTLDAQATRTGPGALRVEWTATAGAAAIYVSSDPDSPREFMRQLKSSAAGGRAELPLASTPRPYLLVNTSAGETRVAERLLPLQGGRNFRDLGGYRTADGRQVRWGKIFRSGVMSQLTPGDMAYLSRIGVRSICDLRSPEERRTEPSAFLTAEYAEVAAFDYDMNSSMAPMLKARTRSEAVDAFADSYVEFLDMLTPHYTDLFARLVRRDGPLALNCSAGKDRTGVGSALILSVLGVPRETVVADYGLTQVYTPPAYYKKLMASGASSSGMTPEMAEAFRRMPVEVLDVLMGSDPEVMRRVLARLDRDHGGPVEVAKARFGLTDAKIATLRATYLV
ncbi:tyrosine-protein phosphatase [Phenylobacterium koreense]|uniref:Protein-tyrosine phosphatase n=1 Tax=Phenylobacterium koreense TaxID=266125 RepID=A0ABV2ENV5_9CAUL